MSRCKDCEKKDKKISDLQMSIKCGSQRELRLVNERHRLLSRIEELKKALGGATNGKP